MSLQISYFSGSDSIAHLVYGRICGADTMTLSGASAFATNIIPANAAVARIRAGEACRVAVEGVAVTATTGVYLAAGETIDIHVRQVSTLDRKIAAMTDAS